MKRERPMCAKLAFVRLFRFPFPVSGPVLGFPCITTTTIGHSDSGIIKKLMAWHTTAVSSVWNDDGPPSRPRAFDVSL